MALFAPVAPASLLRAMRDEWKDSEGSLALGHYHLVLAHDIVENKDGWRGLLPEGSTVIIDNSVIELGSAVAIEAIIEAYHFFREQDRGYKLVVVPPETLDDAYHTFFDFKEGWYKLKPLRDTEVEFGLMYVVQGREIAEINESFDLLNLLYSQNIPVDWIGIPRRLVDNVGTRAYAVTKALQLKLVQSVTRGRNIDVHLLGFSDNIKDDIYCARLPWIHGIDSAVPLRLGQRGEIINFRYDGDQAGPRNDFWTKPGKPHIQTYHNIQSTRHIIKPGTPLASNYCPKLKGNK